MAMAKVVREVVCGDNTNSQSPFQSCKAFSFLSFKGRTLSLGKGSKSPH